MTQGPGGGITSPASVSPNLQYAPNTDKRFRRYETKAQKDAEYANVLSFIDYLNSKYNTSYRVKALATIEKIDYSVHIDNNSKVEFLIECKSHSDSFNPYRNYILDLKNYERMEQLYSSHRMMTVLLVAYTDGLYYWKFDPTLHVEIHAGGRKDRKDPNDILLKVNFSCQEFTKVL